MPNHRHGTNLVVGHAVHDDGCADAVALIIVFSSYCSFEAASGLGDAVLDARWACYGFAFSTARRSVVNLHVAAAQTRRHHDPQHARPDALAFILAPPCGAGIFAHLLCPRGFPLIF
jgi:hypothetical protein